MIFGSSKKFRPTVASRGPQIPVSMSDHSDRMLRTLPSPGRPYQNGVLQQRPRLQQFHQRERDFPQ